MRKKLFTFLFAVMVCTGTMFALSGSCGVKLTWNLTDSVLTISGTGQMYTYYEEYGRRAPWHSYSSEIARVIINDGATSIGNCAFQECSTMTSIEIPNSVTSIGKLAFNKCFALTSIDIPLGVKYIGTEAFYYCSSL